MSWSPEQKSEFAKAYVMTCKLYDKTVELDLARMVVTDLLDLNFEKCFSALAEYRRDSRNKFWPKSADIRGIVQPSPSSRDVAITLARKIDQCVARYGYNWSMGTFIEGDIYFFGGGAYHWTFKEAVIAEIGALGWHAICSRGGWSHVRNSANEMEEGTFIAQMRDQIESSQNLQRQGVDITKIEMIEHKKSDVLSLASGQNVIEIKPKEIK